MIDPVFDAFLEAQFAAAGQINRRSEMLRVTTLDRHRFLLGFRCKGLVRHSDGTVEKAGDFLVGVRFPPDYLRRVNPLDVVTWLAPPNVWHPNVLPPVVCLGHIAPGTPLLDLAFQLYEIISFQNFATHDALNPEAAQWLRNHAHEWQLPLERRPLFGPGSKQATRRPEGWSVEQQ